MKELVTYLTFDGNAREAMTFYAAALGGELHVMMAGDSGQSSGDEADRVMHAKLGFKGGSIMASDTFKRMPMAYEPGNNFALSLDCDSAEEQQRLFDALVAGGTVTMPLGDTFWGARFGMLKDKFGIAWMFNFDKGQSA